MKTKEEILAECAGFTVDQINDSEPVIIVQHEALKAMSDFAAQSVREYKEELAKKNSLDQFLEVYQKLVFTQCEKAVAIDRESRWISTSNPPVIPDGDEFVRLLLRANGHVLFGKYERDEDTGECHFIEVDSSQGSMDLCDHATHYQLLPH